MRTNLFILSLLLAVSSALLYAEEPQKWGESGAYTKWLRYPYETRVNYEFVKFLPTIEQFPKLLELARLTDATPKLIYDRRIAVSQLRTISRCNFEKYLYADSDIEAEHRAAIEKWQRWWDVYGKDYAERFRHFGKTYPKAWTRLPGTLRLKCPTYPLLLPESWSTTLTFRSGDYWGVTREEIRFSVSKNRSRLTRKYSHGMPGSSGWKHEEWKDLTYDEAQEFLAMIIYAVDNPWLFANESIVRGRSKDEIGSIRGRPRVWSNYWPHVSWTGILDASGNIVVNDDVWDWESSDYDRYNKTRVDGTIGVAYRVLLKAFPDPSWRPSRSRWIAVAAPKGEEPSEEPE